MALAAWAGGASTLAAWSLVAPPGTRHAAVALVLLACGAIAWRAVRARPQGVLEWDGAGWTWRSGGASRPVRPRVCLDFQRLLLVSLEPDGARSSLPAGSRWLWLTPAGIPGDWYALRRALYCPSAREAPPEGLQAAP